MIKNWSIEETKSLFSLVKKASDDGKGLVWAFNKVSRTSGKSVNSVRNYYYSQLKMFELVPTLSADLGIELIESKRGDFDLFSENEITELISTILLEKAKGVSVRSTIALLANGDSKKGLRLQNKYRSMVCHHREFVTKVMRKLEKEGKHFFNPYVKKVVTSSEDSFSKLNQYIKSLDEHEVESFLKLLQSFTM